MGVLSMVRAGIILSILGPLISEIHYFGSILGAPLIFGNSHVSEERAPCRGSFCLQAWLPLLLAPARGVMEVCWHSTVSRI